LLDKGGANTEEAANMNLPTKSNESSTPDLAPPDSAPATTVTPPYSAPRPLDSANSLDVDFELDVDDDDNEDYTPTKDDTVACGLPVRAP
jgi:hypothetical protein